MTPVADVAPTASTEPMALTDTDRRRFIAATVLTLLAFPALWYANTSDNSTAPNLAVAGIDPNIDPGVDPGDDVAGRASSAGAGAVAVVDDGLVAPVFLEGPTSAAGAGQSAIAVPARPLVDDFTAKATFRGSVADGTCIVNAVASGTRITVVNLGNNRSMTCTTVLAPDDDSGVLVMRTSAFANIADLTDAPISVEIRR